MHTDFSWLFSLPSVAVSVTHMNEHTNLQDVTDQVTDNVNQPFILLIIWINDIDKLNEVTNYIYHYYLEICYYDVNFPKF